MYKYFTYIIFIFLLLYLSNYLLISDNLYFNTFAEQLTYEQIENIINEGKKWEWIKESTKSPFESDYHQSKYCFLDNVVFFFHFYSVDTLAKKINIYNSKVSPRLPKCVKGRQKLKF